MTRKEAALMLDPETRQCFRVPHRTKDTLQAAFDEACFMGAAALREQEERENAKPLTLDELRKMDGEPVYLVDLVHKSNPEKSDLWGGWIVFSHHLDDGFVPRGNNGWFSTSGYGKKWLAYRNKPKKK